MDIIHLPARGGKTTAAVNYVVEHPGTVYVTTDSRAAKFAWQMSKLPPSQRWRFMSVEEAQFSRNRLLTRAVTGFVVDNVDYILSFMFGAHIRMITVTDPKAQVSDPTDGPERHADSLPQESQG